MKKYKVFAEIGLFAGLKPDEEIKLEKFLLKVFSKEELIHIFDANDLDSFSVIEQKWIEPLVNKPILYFTLRTKDIDQAAIEAGQEYQRFVDMMRFISHFHTFTSRSQLLLPANDITIFRKKAKHPELRRSFGRGSPWEKLEWHDLHAHQLKEKGPLLEQLQKPSFPSDIRKRVERSLYWIGKMSIEKANHLQMIFGVAALENLLYKVKERASKAFLLPVRVMALNSTSAQGFIDPGLIAGLVVLRNQTIHEGVDPLAASKEKVQSLRFLVNGTMVNFLELCRRKRFRDFESLIRYLKSESGDTLTEWLRQVRDSRNKKVVDGLIEAIEREW